MLSEELSWDYLSFRHRCHSSELGEYPSYGIRVVGTHIPSGIKIIRDVKDVSTEVEVVDALVLLCNDLRLDPCHLLDVIQDFMP